MYKYLRYSLFLVIIGCESAFQFDVESESFVVIDGYITNGSSNQSIRVTEASNYNSQDVRFFSNASVYLKEIGGRQYDYEHIVGGIYELVDDVDIQENRNYQLNVVIDENRHYVSRYRHLPKPVIIDSIVWEFDNLVEFDDKGFQISGDSSLAFSASLIFPEDSNYYVKWNYSYHFILPTIIGASNSDNPSDTPPTFCYVIGDSGILFDVVSSDQEPSNKLIAIDKVELDFRFNYQINLNFQALSMDYRSFQYYDAIHKQKLSTGSLFDPTPATISSDFLNLKNVDEVVLGNFGVFNERTELIRIKNSDLNTSFFQSINNCIAGDLPPDDFCSDCRLFNGASSMKPSNWE